MSFARPLLLLALGLLPLWWWLRAKRLARLSGTQMSDVRPAAGAAERLWVARLPVTLRSACLGAWIIAAAGPRIGAARSETRSEGISIVLAVDISGSMQAEDFAPANRIDVAKQTAIEFVRARTSDRIGLVAFAGQALTQVPITTDYAVLEQALRELHPGMLEDGTAIGTAIGTAANRLRRAPGKSKVLVLLTDGVNNKGTVDPRTAGEAAATFGIKIYTIGIGTRGQAPMPTEYGADGQLRYEMRPVEIDEQLLTEIASMTGGRYYRATDTQSLRHIFEEINRLEKTEVEQVVSPREDRGGASRLPALRRSLPRAPRPRAGGARARDRRRGHVRGAGSVMTFDAPVVLALAPLIGGAVWFAAAWARRVRIRRSPRDASGPRRSRSPRSSASWRSPGPAGERSGSSPRRVASRSCSRWTSPARCSRRTRRPAGSGARSARRDGWFRTWTGIASGSSPSPARATSCRRSRSTAPR